MARDPYRYFRVEARELLEGLTQGVLELEKATSPEEVVPRLLRLAHTLKGAARVVKQPAIAELAHAAEGLLELQRRASTPMTADRGSALLALFDRAAEILRALDEPPALAAGSPQAPREDGIETLRIDVQDTEVLLRGVHELGARIGSLRRHSASIDHLRSSVRRLVELLAVGAESSTAARSTAAPRGMRALGLADDLRAELDHWGRGLSATVETLDGTLAEVRDVAHRMRLVPAHTLFPILDRTARDAAVALEKQVEVETSGGDVRLDGQVLASLRDALTHVVRNAVVHGIESPEDRVAAGKSPSGTVRLQVERRGGRVSIACRDDGRGIDVEGVRSAAVTKGRLSAREAQALGGDEVVGLLQSGGLTTSRSVTELSGRGIGLDVLHETVAKLRGEVVLRSLPGQGVSVEVQVPVSIASIEVLLLDVGGFLAAIPLESVRSTLHVLDRDVARSGGRESIVVDGRTLSFAALDNILGHTVAAGPSRRAWSAVIVEAAGRSVALGVDRLVGTTDVVLRAIPDLVGVDPAISGASLDADGDPQPVLDPAGIVARVEGHRGAPGEAAAPRRARVLVIDDSLTTRMLEQSILESAGYEVDLAVSAEEGLAKARAERYRLFLVDVEMPGMDGFGFVAETRASADLRDIPSILVTSRDAPEDRRRGEQVGARAYVVKGEFDQERMLSTIRSLLVST